MSNILAMEQYIKKSAVLAEIRKYKNNAEAYLKYHHNRNDKSVYAFEQEKLAMCELLSFLNTLEGNGVIAGQECICNGVFNKIIGSTWNLTIPLDKVGLKHGDKVEVLIIKR